MTTDKSMPSPTLMVASGIPPVIHVFQNISHAIGKQPQEHHIDANGSNIMRWNVKTVKPFERIVCI